MRLSLAGATDNAMGVSLWEMRAPLHSASCLINSQRPLWHILVCM